MAEERWLSAPRPKGSFWERPPAIYLVGSWVTLPSTLTTPLSLSVVRAQESGTPAATSTSTYLMGSGPLVLGHAHPAVVTAVKAAVEGGSTFFAINEAAVLLAEELVKAIPCAQKVRFTTSGTDACFQGFRIARSFRKRDKVLKFEGGFHGTSDYALMSTFPRSLRDYPQAEASSGGIPRAIEDLVLIAPFNDSEATTAIIEKHHQKLAAVIVEPVQRFLAPKPGFLQTL